MATFNIDGLLYTDKLPHSRIERILYAILKKQGSGGGGDDVDLVVDDPSDVGDGLAISDNKLKVNATSIMVDSSDLITSGAVYDQIEMAETILSHI